MLHHIVDGDNDRKPQGWTAFDFTGRSGKVLCDNTQPQLNVDIIL